MTTAPNAPDALTLLGALPLRVRILRLALERDEVTAADVMDATGATRNGIAPHLTELTDAGFLHARRATHPRGTGGIIYWSANREHIAAALWAFTGDLLGYHPAE
ncbi:ArsR/SmtB family transcription factor [Plantibacter sp. CFBP 8804]|uniref:ArsR/SmtB family transcription factor n=1 Tax=Plantibacter sp. CFBP 8804 TaxID=2775270 RepID=UPI001784300A|nr:helix-turn-helix transcriptional regulator [Plantibacter sp. CFBP 8804]MBD8519174.1 helix-turn-helix transcriptional regulator [Plantibacter sp. CFBP 8804]